jgi:peroxiredoxin Q/BCP
MPTLVIDQMAPAFALYNQHDHVIKLERLTNLFDHVVVYFFPQANAPGCTREALGFKELIPEFTARNVAVVGITSSPAKEVAEFAKTNNLNFDVLSDIQTNVCDEWGALRDRVVARMTYVLNDRGRITHIFPRADVFKHPAEVLALFPAPAAPAQAAAPATQAPATQAPATQAGPVATTPAELIVATARAAVQLLLAHKDSGGQVPADVVELCKRVSG